MRCAKSARTGCTAPLDAGRMGSWELDLGTKRLAWSREMEAIHGLQPATFAGTFEAYEQQIHPDERAYVRSAMTDTQREEQYLEYRIVRADGAVRWVESRAMRCAIPPARRSAWSACMDITERKQVEQALRETSRAKDEFLAMLSHELRNPLAALSAAAHVLKLAHPNDAPAIKARAVERRRSTWRASWAIRST